MILPIRPVVFEDTGKLDDRSRAFAPGAPRRPAVACPLHRPGLRASRSLASLPGADDGRHSARHPARAAFASTAPEPPGFTKKSFPVTARWTDPKIRKTPLSPYAREAETEDTPPLAGLADASGETTGRQKVQQQLQTSAARDVKELLPHLQARGEEYAKDAKQKLQTRGQQEAKAMQAILETQRKHIGDTEAKHARDEMQGVIAILRKPGRSPPARSEQALLGQATDDD